MSSSGPRRFNVVTVSFLLALAAGGYWMWKIFPVYYTAWQVDHLLGDAAIKARRFSGNPAEFAPAQRELETSLRGWVAEAGVSDPDLTCRVKLDDLETAAECDYLAVVVHPWVRRATLFEMHRRVITPK